MKIYRNKEEMLKKDREDFLSSDINIQELVIKDRKVRSKKKLKIVIFIIIFFVLFKLVIGTLYFRKIQPYRGYEVYANNEMITFIAIEEYRKVIIPYMAEFYDYNENIIGEGKNEVILKDNEPLYLKVKEYACYTKDNILKNCNDKVAKKEYFGYPNSHYNILILEDDRSRNVLYEGSLTTDDYSKYFKKGKRNRVFIYGGYENVSSTLTFYVVKE